MNSTTNRGYAAAVGTRVSGISRPNHPVPYGTDLVGDTFSRHFVPGYDRPVPTGRLAALKNVQTAGTRSRTSG